MIFRSDPGFWPPQLITTHGILTSGSVVCIHIILNFVYHTRVFRAYFVSHLKAIS